MLVEAVDPMGMMSVAGDDALDSVAGEATDRLKAALQSLADASTRATHPWTASSACLTASSRSRIQGRTSPKRKTQPAAGSGTPIGKPWRMTQLCTL